MANLCSNNVRIEGLDADTIEAFTTLMTESRFFGFFIPEPDFSHDPTNSELIQWRNDHWGSKWDVGEAYIEVVDGVFHAIYDSAWAPHCEGFATLAQMYPDARITLHYSEDGAGFYGKMTAHGDEVVDECHDMY